MYINRCQHECQRRMHIRAISRYGIVLHFFTKQYLNNSLIRQLSNFLIGLTLGTCYTSVSRTGSCNSPIEGQFTKNDCCRGQIGSYSLAWSDSNKCELCEGVTGIISAIFSYPCIAIKVPLVYSEFHSCELNTCPCGGKPTKRQVNYFYIRAPEDYIEGSATAWLGFSGIVTMHLLYVVSLYFSFI